MVQDCEVTAVEVERGKVTGVKSTQGDYAAPVVVNCAGPWAARIGGMVGMVLPIDTWQHDTMMVQRPKEIGPSHPTVIDDVNEITAWDLPESDDYETVAGYVLYHTGRIPELGQKLQIGDAEFEILKASSRKIESVRIHRLPPHEQKVG